MDIGEVWARGQSAAPEASQLRPINTEATQVLAPDRVGSPTASGSQPHEASPPRRTDSGDPGPSERFRMVMVGWLS